MSTLVFKLLIHLCVWMGIFQAYGIQNFHYPTRFNNNQWRVSKRQDLLTKSRLVLWKPALSPGQIYANVKKPAIPLNFNRYGIQSPPIMAPIHQNYMIAIPTKVNYASYQSMKDIEENRKPGNLHHITIINAIMPKPYLSTAPTHSHPAATFQNYRANSKQLHHQYFNNFGRPNMEKLNQINVQQFQLQHQQPQQHLQLVYPSSPLALQINKPTTEYKNVKNYNTNSDDIEHEGNEINSPISQCGRKTKHDTNNSASDVIYYYCNNRITNYKNPTQQQLISIQPTTTTTTTTTFPSTTTSTTTTEIPSTTAKSSHFDFNNFSTEKPIFLPTPNAPLENSFIPITSATMLTNSNSGQGDNFNLQKQKKFKPLRQTASRYEDIKRQQPYTTSAPYDSMKFHSFFTIEDAVTRSPEMQVFNDPYQAYRHARRQQISHQRQTITTTKIPETTTTTAIPKTKFKSFFDDLDDEDYLQEYRHDRRQHINHQRQVLTTTKIPETTTTNIKPKYKSFFDVLDDEDYFLPEVHQDDYSLFSKPKKSVYHKLDYKNEFEFPKQNRIINHGHRTMNDNDFTTVGETFAGKPKIKEHHFGLFKSIAPTPKPLPVVTTYKPNGDLKELFATTLKIPSSTPHNYKPLTYTTTFDTVMGNEEPVEKENYTPILNEVRTTNTIPMTTTSTEKNFISHTFKPTSSLRSSTPFKYPKQRRLHKPYKNLTSTTTKATTTVKKVPKYQRQYKTKKLKQFKHLYTTTSSTTTTTTTSSTSSTSTSTSTSTTTTPIPTTVETHTTTRRPSARLLQTTSTTEEPSTKKAVFSRIFSTTEAPKQKSFRNQTSLSTEATKRKKIKPRTSTASAIKINDSEIGGRTVRRGSKRAHVVKNEKETTQATITKASNKNRRRLNSSSTTAKPSLSRSMSGLVSTTTFSSTPTSASHRTSSTTTTMKSIMKISNSKARGKLHNELRYSTNSSEMKDDRKELDGRMTVKSITSTMANIPPLPIEIYFKKSHNPKI